MTHPPDLSKAIGWFIIVALYRPRIATSKDCYPMAQIREIKNRIKAVANIQRITRTMQMIATAKFQASVRRAQAAKPYTQKLAELVGELAESAGADGHPLLCPPAHRAGRELILVISSNRGLAGAYNANVLRRSMQFIRNNDTQTELEVAGKKGIAFFKFAGREVARTHLQFAEVAYDDVEEVASRYIAAYEAGEYDAIRVAYMKFVSNSKQEPTIMKLLPLDRPEAERPPEEPVEGVHSVYEFSPSPEKLLNELLPLTVKSQLFQCFNDAVVSEHLARMVAMKSATDNAGKMVKALRRQFNRARQTQITTELSEIIGGAAALS